LVVAGDDFPKPSPSLTGAIMLAAPKLSLDRFELLSFATIRFFAVIGQTVKVSVLWRCPQITGQDMK
jgi:hypothetical protein